jgi:hypothetical protein
MIAQPASVDSEAISRQKSVDNFVKIGPKPH